MLDRETSKIQYASLVIAGIAGVVTWLVSRYVFPFHSSNHDEGVYLQHAEMLLDGQLKMQTGELTDAFIPWFFIADNGAVYPKYQPVTAAIYAAGEFIYSYRLALVVVAVVNIYLVYLIASTVFDERAGIVAMLSLFLSPLYLIQSGLYLSYAPTAMLNFAFMYFYLRSWRQGSKWYGLIAGVCIGAAFFSRPYTAVLYASPFIIHSLYILVREFRYREHGIPDIIEPQFAIALMGMVFIALTLIYNWVMTGSLFTFPYLEFAPRDGIGFGEHEIVGYTQDYTPMLALRANSEVLLRFLTIWGPGGIIGGGLALTGLFSEVRNRSIRTGAFLLIGVALSIMLGNIYFWGNLNILGILADPRDGLISLYGTLYHFELLLPVSVLIGVAVTRSIDIILDRGGERKMLYKLSLAVILVSFVLMGGVSTMDKMGRNLDVTDNYRAAYSPFMDSKLDNSLVFLPTPLGDWLNHPFQYLRNDADLNGSQVYAMDNDEEKFEVIDEYSDREFYRYIYRGNWAPVGGSPVNAELERFSVVRGEELWLNTTLPVSRYVYSVSATLREDDSVFYTVNHSDNASINLYIANGTASIRDGAESIGNESILELNERGELDLEITITERIDSHRYIHKISYESINGSIRVLSPPYTELCYSARNCGGESAYLGDELDVSTLVSPVDRP